MVKPPSSIIARPSYRQPRAVGETHGPSGPGSEHGFERRGASQCTRHWVDNLPAVLWFTQAPDPNDTTNTSRKEQVFRFAATEPVRWSCILDFNIFAPLPCGDETFTTTGSLTIPANTLSVGRHILQVLGRDVVGRDTVIRHDWYVHNFLTAVPPAPRASSLASAAGGTPRHEAASRAPLTAQLRVRARRAALILKAFGRR